MQSNYFNLGKEGNVWLTTFVNGVWKYNGDELIHYPIKDGGTNVMLFTIYKDKQGFIWLGTHHSGIYKFIGNSFE